MYYSVIGILAFLVLIIENRDTFFARNNSGRLFSFFTYRRFLLTVAVYYVLDALWGVFEYYKLSTLLFLDTSLYFIAMAMGVLFWTRATVTYLEEKNVYAKFLTYSGRIFAAAVTALIVVNCFTPIFFSVDENCVYHAFSMRYIALLIQIILFLLISVNSLTYISRGEKDKKLKYSALASFGVIMAALLIAQLFFPYLPLCSIGYLLGTSILHAFVIGDERNKVKKIVTKDVLTKVGNKYAFDNTVAELDKSVQSNSADPFAIVVCDINDLKIINDTKGHIVGDAYIKDACKTVCDVFKHSQVFRIGGDEFVVICRGQDYENINDLLKEMHAKNTESRKKGAVQIAYGMARFDKDTEVQDVFHRADKKMYEHKIWLKAKGGTETVLNTETVEKTSTYKFPEGLKKAYESSPFAFVYYQNINNAPVPVLISEGFCRNTGMNREDIMQWLKDERLVSIHPDDIDVVNKVSNDFYNKQGNYDIIYRSRLGSGDYDPEFESDDEKYVQIHATGRWQTMPDGTELAVIYYSELSETQKAIQESAEIYKLLQRDHFYTDPLTGLPNLNYLHEFGNERVEVMRSSDKTPSVVYTDIYSIQSYNDRYGVKEGDSLLCLTAETLKEKFPDSVVVRGSDDHFIIVTDIDDIHEIEKRLYEANKTIISSASGVTSGIRSGVCPLDSKISLLNALDRAKHTIKLIANNMNREVAFFSEAANNDYLKERYIVEHLQQAIDKGWIKVYYQALYRVETLKIAAFEGLSRWEDPVQGLFLPSDYIPVLQKYHQLHRFDLFVFEQVCREFKTRYDNGLPLVPVSVNFSMQDFDYANILSEMNALYKKYHLDVLVDKSYFIIEITEQDLAIGTEKLKEQFNLIRENGYRLWLDDFGSGYSALNVFSQFDFDLVKYDMELLKNLDFNNGINRIILKELVFLSKKFGIHTLIEGVETEEQFSFVKEIGCELAQGFYFHKPESLDGILNRIHNGESPKMCETPKERAEFNRKWFE